MNSDRDYQYRLSMQPEDAAELVRLLKSLELRLKGMATLTLTTPAERDEYHYQMAIVQGAYLQLEGIAFVPRHGAPDWSAAEASGTLPSEALAKIFSPILHDAVDGGAAHEAAAVADCEVCAQVRSQKPVEPF